MIYSKYTNNRVQKTKQISCEVVTSLHEKTTFIIIKDAVDNTTVVIFHIITCTSVLL